MKAMAGIVIIGAGQCGVQAAFALRDLGYRGPVTLIGSQKNLPCERAPLTQKDAGSPKPFHRKSTYSKADIDLRLGLDVEKIDLRKKRVVLSNDDVLNYQKLLLTTGAKPKVFAGLAECQYLRSSADARALHAEFKPGVRIGIVGGGFIGLELAAAARQAGAEVTVFEAGPRILGRTVPPEIAAIVEKRHRAEGVEIRTGVGVISATRNSIKLVGGTKLDFDLAIACVGAEPATDIAEKARLIVDNGVVVDDMFRSSAPDVFAAGDCCNFEWRGYRARLQARRAYKDQGAFAAASMLGKEIQYDKVPGLLSHQFDLSLRVAGQFNPTPETWLRDLPGNTRLVFQCDDTGQLSAAAGIGSGNAVSRDISIFEKLIEKRAVLDPHLLADPANNLNRLLQAI